MPRPLIAITADLRDRRHAVRCEYVQAIRAAGGLALVLPAAGLDDPNLARSVLDSVDGVLLSGGGDPDTVPFGAPVHPAAALVDPERQRSETGLIRALEGRPELPVLGVCLGMQMMGLVHGARLIQHLDEHLAAPELHRDDRLHAVEGPVGRGRVCSHHHQALADAGALEPLAWSPDGVLEAVGDPRRRFYLGVQWHPERTPEAPLGHDLVARFVAAARRD